MLFYVCNAMTFMYSKQINSRPLSWLREKKILDRMLHPGHHDLSPIGDGILIRNLKNCKNIFFKKKKYARFFKEYSRCWSNLKALYRGTATPLCNYWPWSDRTMKFGPEVALDATIADTKFQGSGYTGSSGKADTRIVLDQFFQCSQCYKS